MPMRKITVDGRAYEWSVLNDCIRVRTAARVNFRLPFPDGVGVCSRGGFDDETVAPVTPGLVADLIRQHEGRPSAFERIF